MERCEESGEGGEEKAEILWEKVRRVGKRGGHSTPAASFWRTNELGLSANSATGCGGLHDTFGIISSRKLAAALWELHQHKLPLDNMRRGVNVPPPQLPESSSNLSRRVADSLMQHHQSIEKSDCATKTVSPSNCSSSMEIASCNSATSSSSIELKGRNGEITNSLRTSTELLKVLNRVWSLEEQHVSNMSLIKALKKELDRARFHAKELAREQQGGRHEMDEVLKHITGGKLPRRNNEQERIKAKVQSTRDELENQRKLRKQLESLQRELAQELYEMKSSLASISKELEKERMSRGFLEDLCDELAWGVRDCEKELRDQRQKSDKDLGERDDHDQLILRISQAWLDERMQVKQQNRTIQNERNSKAKINGKQMVGNPMYQKSSLESIPLNLGASACREEDDNDDDGSSSSHSSCFEVEKTSECSLKPQGQKNPFEEMQKEKKLKSSDRTRALSPLRLQAKFEEHMARAMSYGKSSRSFQSPVREWTEKLPAQDLDTSETPLKFLPELKESFLREKPFEARSRGQKSRSCQKSPIHPSRDE